MLSRLKRNAFDEVLNHKVQYLLIVFFLVVGITAGTFTVSKMDHASKTELSSYTQLLFITIKAGTVDHFTVFVYSWLQNTAVFAVMTAFSLLMIGLPVIAVLVVFKGFCVGFTVGVLSLSFGAGGLAAIVFATFLPSLILLPCICKAGVMGWNQSIIAIQTRNTPQTTHDRLIMARPFFAKMLRVYLVVLLGVIIESLLSTSLMQIV